MFKKKYYNNTFYSTLYYFFFYIFEIFFICFQSTMDAEIKNSSSSSKIIIDKCVVKGYHAFKIRPPSHLLQPVY